MTSLRNAMIASAALWLTACGDNTAADPANPAPSETAPKGASAAEPAAQVIVSKAKVEQAWNCLGATQAAIAYQAIKGGNAATGILGALNSEAREFWEDRTKRLTFDGMDAGALDRLKGDSIRVVLHDGALDAMKPELEACEAARAALG